MPYLDELASASVSSFTEPNYQLPTFNLSLKRIAHIKLCLFTIVVVVVLHFHIISFLIISGLRVDQ
jgi:hypothetical protein